jgi:hypothetical protein
MNRRRRLAVQILIPHLCSLCALWCAPFLSAPPALAQEGQAGLLEAVLYAGFDPLFDGVSLQGWTASGDIAAWRAEEGELRCTGAGGGWLRTTRMFRDFELQLEFLLPPGGNSGVGLRGSSEGDPAFTGFEIQVLDSHGHEPSLSNCGAVYNAIPPAIQVARPAGQWNHLQVRLVGDRLDAWLNHERIHDNQRLDDRGFFRAPDQPLPLRDRLTTGFIALQDHGDAVRFRKIYIRDLSPDPDPGGFQPLFNGRDLHGWFAKGAGSWSVEGGTLVGRDGGGHLYTERVYTDVEVRALVRVNERGNGGLYVRAAPPRDNPDSWPIGLEAQIDHHDATNWTGCLYARAHPIGGYERTLLTRDGAWFDYRVRIEGARARTWVNGVPMVDAQVDGLAQGHIALQTHHPGNVIEWRDIQVRDLAVSPAPGSPAR